MAINTRESFPILYIQGTQVILVLQVDAAPSSFNFGLITALSYDDKIYFI